MMVVRTTIEEFKNLPETSEQIELIDGEVIVSPSPTEAHQSASMSIIAYFIRSNFGGTLRHAPFEVYIGGSNAPQPDLFWISPDNSDCHLIENYYHGAPDLIIEILSPSTAHRDRGRKYDIYEQYGVREYWLVDPEALFVEVYVRAGEKFARHGVFGRGEKFISPTLNAEIDVMLLLGQPA
jgi:Uma2 family endonuclease